MDQTCTCIFNYRRFTHLVSAGGLLIWFVTFGAAGCSKLNDKGGFLKPSAYFFQGVNKITNNGDGTFSLSWDQVPASDVAYVVYSRTATRAYDYTTPDDSVKEVTWKTKDLSFEPNTCYIVHYRVPGAGEDNNTNEKCTEHKPLEFDGASDLSDNGDGTWSLLWDKVAAQDVTYRVYKRVPPQDYNYSKPVVEQKETTYTSENLSFVGNACFTVRFVKTGVKADDNAKELCTNASPVSFKGLDSIDIADDGSLKLNWTKIQQDGVVYLIYRTDSPGQYDFSSSKAWNAVSDLSTYSVPKFALDQRHCFVVRYSKVGAPEDTNTKEICPGLAYISSFTGISTATSTVTGTALISWAAPSSATGISSYRIYQGADMTARVSSADGTALSLSIAGLSPDETYTFGVRAVDSYGREDSNHKTVNVTIVNNNAPSFTGLASVTKSSASSIALTWLSADGRPESYKIYEGLGATGTTPAVSYTSPVQTVTGSTTSATISGLGDDQAYCFDVRAVSSGGQESTAANVKCVTLPDYGAANFDGITGAQFTAGGATISWTPTVDQVSQYLVYYQQGASINFSTASVQVVANTTPPATPVSSATVLGLQDNTQYTFAVRAQDSHVVKDSNTATRTVTSGDLTPPVFLGVTSLTAVDETHLSVTFNRSTESDMDHYSIRVKLSSDSGLPTEFTSVAQPSSGSTVTATIGSAQNPLLPATSYDVLVRAIDTSGNASTNTAITTRATLDLTAPTFSGISSVGLDPADQSKVKVSWSAGTDTSGVLGYRVYYSTASLSGCASSLVWTVSYPHSFTGCGASVSISTLVTSATNISFGGLTEGSTYYFIVHAIDNSNVNNEDTNTVQSAFNVPYYTPPAVPTSVAIVGGNGPSANNAITVTGTAMQGNTVKVYVNSVFAAQQVLNSGTSFSIPVTLSTTAGNYLISASQVNLSSVEGTQSSPITYVLQNQAPTATLSGMPCSPTSCYTNTTSPISVTVAGTNLITYQYSLIFSATTISTACSDATFNGTWIAAATHITNAISTDGNYRLCVIGKDSAGNSQSAVDATQYDFTRATAPPAAPSITSFKDPVTNSTTESYNGVVSVVLGSVGGASKYCAKGATSAPATPASNDTCWTASTSVSAALSGAGGATTANYIYTWSMDDALNISTSPTTSSSTINYVNICSSGNLATTCTVSTTRTLASGGATIGGQGSLVIGNGGVVNGGIGNLFTLTLGGDFTVAGGGTWNANATVNAVNITISGVMKANGLGYAGVTNAAGLGGTSGGAAAGSYAAGGGHGGAGGSHGSAAGGVAYGSLQGPTEFGGSGGSYSGQASGAGGGAIKLNATGNVVINQTLSADGSLSAGWSGAGSAGGSIWVIAGASLSGTGSISALGSSPNGAAGTGAAGGGGGRVSITAPSPFLGSININGGLGYQGGAYNGDPGTLYTNYSSICDSGTLSTTCTVTSSFKLGENASISGSGNLIVDGGAISIYKPTSAMSIAMTGNVTVQNSGSINANLTTLSAANVSIDATSSINADGLGYMARLAVATGNGGTSAGVSSGSTTIGAGGGAHGGWGGRSAYPYYGHGTGYLGGETVYGSDAAPITFGSAGGTMYFGGWRAGGAGGGAIKVVVAGGGSLTVDGNLSSNGASGISGGATGYSTGGGAGGSLWIQAGTIAGSGTISAAGGDGGYGGGIYVPSGGGGGGRLVLTSTNHFSGTLSVNGGAAGGSGATGGMSGVANFTDKDNYCGVGTLASTCTISKSWRFLNGDSLSGTALVIASTGAFVTLPTETMSVTMTGDVTIQSGGTINANLSNLSAANLTVIGSINADGLGYQGLLNATGNGVGTGPGIVNNGSNVGGGGGAHGGAGGKGYGGSATVGQPGAAGVAYDSAASPVQMGSAGGGTSYSGSYASGADGGGLIILSINGTITVTGSISADGRAGYTASNTGSGGGAGGSISLSTHTLDGTGSVTAKGGAGGQVAWGGGGGGGGLILITRTSDTFSGTCSATGGTGGAGATNGANGVVTLQ